MSLAPTITEREIEGVKETEYPAGYTATEDQAVEPSAFPCDWLSEVRRQIAAIESLPPGWDSHGSPSPNLGILEAGWGLLFCLCTAGRHPKPHVNPTPGGGVQFEWEGAERYFELEMISERTAVYFYRDDAAGLEDEGEVFAGGSLEPVLKYISNVAAAQ